MTIRDVAVHTNQSIFSVPENDKAHPLPPDPFHLGHDLWIGKIDSDAARIVLELAEPSYYGTPKPVIQYAQLYCFVREKDAQAAPYHWDEDSRPQTCVAVSRLVHTTTVSVRYGARIRYNSDSSIADVSPANIRGVGIDTFLSASPQRDWLTETEAFRLRDLLQKLYSSGLLDRVSRALWYHEYAVRTYYVEMRWVLVATGMRSVGQFDLASNRATQQIPGARNANSEVQEDRPDMQAVDARQVVLAKRLLDGATITDAARDAGYSEKNLAQSGHQALKAIRLSMPELLDEIGDAGRVRPLRLHELELPLQMCSDEDERPPSFGASV